MRESNEWNFGCQGLFPAQVLVFVERLGDGSGSGEQVFTRRASGCFVVSDCCVEACSRW